jgi:hypothetical protein
MTFGEHLCLRTTVPESMPPNMAEITFCLPVAGSIADAVDFERQAVIKKQLYFNVNSIGTVA